jgi:magnesium chelatase subunit D
LGEILLEAALASLPPDVLAQLASARATQIKGGGQSRSGEIRQSRSRGSPLPPRPGLPRQGARLHVLATLGHAAPRQKLRSPSAISAGTQALTPRLKIRAEDFHIHRFAQRSQTCLIFAIDASGSAALHRLAEAKGAVELLLAQSYSRRDQVCVVGFRGTQAEVLLPPTKSLVRAKRSLAGLPGGGGTPPAPPAAKPNRWGAIVTSVSVTMGRSRWRGDSAATSARPYRRVSGDGILLYMRYEARLRTRHTECMAGTAY